MRSFRPHFRRKESFAAAEVRRKMQDKHQTKERDYPFEEKLLEDTIGYHFKTPALLKEALTHSSYANELKTKNLSCICNERLEFCLLYTSFSAAIWLLPPMCILQPGEDYGKKGAEAR